MPSSCLLPKPSEVHRVLSFHTHSGKTKSHISSLHPDIAAQVMYRRLHTGVRRLNKLPRLTSDAPDNLERASPTSLPHSITANAKRLPHRESRYEESRPGRLIHGDIAGPFVSSAVGHYQYLLVLIDDHTRFKFAFPLVHRRDAPSRIREFIASFNSYASRSGSSAQPIATLHTDGAGEFTSDKFRNDLADLLVHKTESPPEVHALNGVAERAILSIFSHVPVSYTHL